MLTARAQFTDDDLRIVIESSDDPLKIRYARRIRPLRRRGNLLLCTLLLGCTLVNAIIAVLLADETGGMIGTILTTAAIVVFGEIVPQSVCSRHALAVGAYSLPIVYVFVVVFLPIALPISLVLDWILGEEISGVFTRNGLLALIKLNVESREHQKQSGLTSADAKLMGGALTFKDQAIGNVMTPIETVFCLRSQTTLDQKAILQILATGHTRIPVYEGHQGNVVGLLFCKDLLGIGFERELPLATVLSSFHSAQRVHKVQKSTKLNHALDLCKERRVHMLVVTSDEDPDGDAIGASRLARTALECTLLYRSLTLVLALLSTGIATMEDFLEEILQEEIVDETDVFIDNKAAAAAAAASHTTPSRCARKLVQTSKTKRKFERINSKHYDTTTLLKSLGASSDKGAAVPWSKQWSSSSSIGSLQA